MKFADRLKFTATGTSAAMITVGAAVLGCRTPAQVISDGANDPLAIKVGDTGIPFTVDDGAGNEEVSLFTITSTTQITRTSVLSSSAGGTSPATFTGSTLTVFNCAPASFLNSLASAAIAKATTDDTLSAGSLVYLKSTGHCGLSDATAEGKESVAFALAACSSGQTASLAFSGSVISGLSGLTPGAFYYMSTTPGTMTLVAGAPTASGNVLMKVGTAISATQLLFAPEAPVTL